MTISPINYSQFLYLPDTAENTQTNKKEDQKPTKDKLIDAAKSGKKDVVENLLNQKDIKSDDINGRDNRNRTALHYAAEKNSLDIVKLLVEKGKADLAVFDNDKKSPYQLNINSETGKYLFKKMNEELDSLEDKMKQGDDKAKKRGWDLMNAGAISSRPREPQYRSQELFDAIREGDLNALEFLIGHDPKGEGIDIRDKNHEQDNTALMVAAMAGNKGLEMVKLLVDKGRADMAALNNRGKSALHLAKDNEKAAGSIVPFLQEKMNEELQAADEHKDYKRAGALIKAGAKAGSGYDGPIPKSKEINNSNSEFLRKNYDNIRNLTKDWDDLNAEDKVWSSNGLNMTYEDIKKHEKGEKKGYHYKDKKGVYSKEKVSYVKWLHDDSDGQTFWKAMDNKDGHVSDDALNKELGEIGANFRVDGKSKFKEFNPKHDEILQRMENMGGRIWDKGTFGTGNYQLEAAGSCFTRFKDAGILIIHFKDTPVGNVVKNYFRDQTIVFSEKLHPEAYDLIRHYIESGGDDKNPLTPHDNTIDGSRETDGTDMPGGPDAWNILAKEYGL